MAGHRASQDSADQRVICYLLFLFVMGPEECWHKLALVVLFFSLSLQWFIYERDQEEHETLFPKSVYWGLVFPLLFWGKASYSETICFGALTMQNKE